MSAEAGTPFVVRQFEGTPWVPLHEAARLHDAVEDAGMTIASLRNTLAIEIHRGRLAEAGTLDEAWAAAEAALPEGWGIRRLERWPGQDWEVVAIYALGGFVKGNGPTPAAALHALVTALRAVPA